jgi:hypothetical protein
VTLGQGYLFSPPMLPEAFKDWLLDHGAGPTPPFEAMIRENNGLREAH